MSDPFYRALDDDFDAELCICGHVWAQHDTEIGCLIFDCPCAWDEVIALLAGEG